MTRWSWDLATGPAQEPITVAEAKGHARITHADDDATLTRFIKAAREEAERVLSRGLFTQTWTFSSDRFYDEMYLPMAAPLQNNALASPSTAPIVKYYDVNGALQTLATTFYDVDTVSRPGRIVRASGTAWPALQADRIAAKVVITYVVGWSSVALIPERIKQGIRMYVTYLDCDREGLEPAAAQARAAAENCWNDKLTWIEPTACYAHWP